MNIKLYQLDRYWTDIKDDVLDAIDGACSTGLGQNSPAVQNLEKNLLSISKTRKHAVTLASCTDAIACAIQALCLPPKSYIALPSLTFIGVANSILRSEMIPYFVDCDEYGHIDLSKVPKKCRAVIVADLWGCAMDYSAIENFTRDNPNIRVIMDAAQSLETINGISSLAVGDIAVTSFSPSKTVPSFGSGGALFTDDDEFAKFARLWRLHGKTKNSDEAIVYGSNSMMSTMEASQLLISLGLRKQNLKIRSAIAHRYIDALKKSSVKPIPYRGNHSWHKFIINAGLDRDYVMDKFAVHNIETRVFYSPLIHEEKLFAEFPRTSMTNSHKFVEETLAIPCQHTLHADEVDYICSVLESLP